MVMPQAMCCLWPAASDGASESYGQSHAAGLQIWFWYLQVTVHPQFDP